MKTFRRRAVDDERVRESDAQLTKLEVLVEQNLKVANELTGLVGQIRRERARGRGE